MGKVSSVQTTLNSTRLFILRINHSNVRHVKERSIKRSVLENIFLAKSTKSSRKSYRTHLLSKLKNKTKLNVRQNLRVSKARQPPSARLFHKRMVKLLQEMIPQVSQTSVRFQVMLIWLHQLTPLRETALCWQAVIRCHRLSDQHPSCLIANITPPILIPVWIIMLCLTCLTPCLPVLKNPFLLIH